MNPIQSTQTATSTDGTLKLKRTDPRPTEFEEFEKLAKSLMSVSKKDLDAEREKSA